MSADWEQWRDVRARSRAWLEPWEPLRPNGTLDPSTDASAFASRCSARERERQLGSSYAFGVFRRDGGFVGEVNISNVLRSAFMSGHVGYWVDVDHAGHGYVPEALVGVFRFAFDDVGLHRLQISIIPRNTASRRVVDKLAIRDEGVAERYLLINGVWEDHVRYAITAEEWHARRGELIETWLG